MKPRLQKTYNYIVEYIKKYNNSPSIREIQKYLDIKSTSTVHNDIKELINLGYIKRPNMKSRSIELLKNEKLKTLDNPYKEEIIDIPILGEVAAGSPILAEENIENYFPIQSHLIRGGEFFMLRVNGDSMIDIGIYDGDLILVKKTNYANHGDIVVALIEDGATVKRLYNKNNQIMLIPENSSMEPIIPDHLNILGIVISLFREHI